MREYTSDAFSGFDKEDIEGLIKNRYDEAKAEMTASLASLKDLLANVPDPKTNAAQVEYFCGPFSETAERIARREALYTLTASLTRSFANCCEKLVSDYGYSEGQVERLRGEISDYNTLKQTIRLGSCDYIDLKPYEADMRYILDTYIRAEDSRLVSKMADKSLVELLLESDTTPEDFVKDLPGDNNAKAEIIDNNLRYEIVQKLGSNEVYYGRLSAMLEEAIAQRKAGAMSYEEYLNHVVKFAQAIFHPEEDDAYPAEIRDSAARRALYDSLERDADLTLALDHAIRVSLRPRWKNHPRRSRNVKLAIYSELLETSMAEEAAKEKAERIFNIAKRQEEYD